MKRISVCALLQAHTLSHDLLIEALSGTVDTNDRGVISYRNALGWRHRTDGPAMIHPSGAEVWYRNGRIHRVGGAAVSYPTGEQHWLQNGRYHRTDGPAVIQEDGDVYWFLNDMRLSEEEFNRRIASGDYRDP